MINLVVALNRDNLIGLDGTLPWSNRPEDMKNFSRITRGHSVVMGRKTYESIGKPLPDRLNIVISRKGFQYEDDGNILMYTSVDRFVNNCDPTWNSENIFIIGGMQVYKSFAPFVERMYITVIDEYNPPFQGREATYFPWPAFLDSTWQCIEQRKLGPDFFYIYERSNRVNKKTQEYG